MYKSTLYFIVCLFLGFTLNAQTFNTGDVDALEDFLQSTGGGTPTAPAGWNAALPTSSQWVAANPLDSWYGLTWSAVTTDRRLLKLEMTNLGYGTSPTGGIGLTGALPNDFISLTGKMSRLEVFDVRGNRLNDGPTIPWVYTASSLNTVDISDNRFGLLSGATIFTNILAGASALQELYASGYLSGTAITTGINLPVFPTAIANLTVLDLGNNGLRGDASALLTLLVQAQSIYLNNNRIEQLPLISNTSINDLVLDFNELDSTAYLENVLANYTSLTHLSAINAMNTGILQGHTFWSNFTIGSNFTNVVVDLSFNKLTGSLDMNDPAFGKLESFTITNNELTSITAPTTPINGLRVFNISENNINQSLDLGFFENLPLIEELYLSENIFSGPLPIPTSTAYNLQNLKKLGLTNCQIGGDLNLAWLLDAQNAVATGGRNGQLYTFFVNGNDFDAVIPHSFGTTMPFDTLKQLFVQDNRFDFADLYNIVTAFGMPGTANGYGFLNPNANFGEFIYSPQAPVGMGGVRRRRAGRATRFRPTTIPPVRTTQQDTLYNSYEWFRRDTAAGALGFEFLGRVRSNANVLNGSNININLGSTSITNGTLNLLPSLRSRDFGSLRIENLDSTHNGWIYYADILNDSFPFLTLEMNPKRLIVGSCYDSLGNEIRCQEILVRYNPDSVAAYSGPGLALFQERIRQDVGAEKVDECECGDLELWEMHDTTNQIEVEAYGRGTRSTTTQSSNKAELLSAETNYYVESSEYTIPTTPPNFSQGTTHPRPTLVAVIDSGTDYDHPQIRERLWINPEDTTNDGQDDDGDCIPDNGWGYNFVEDTNIPYDDHGHGTAVAGIVGGLSSNNIAQNYSNYDSLAIIPMKMTDREANGTLYHAACAIFHAGQYKDANSSDSLGIRVINASWGYYGEPSPSLEDALNYIGQDCGMLFITSAGNDGIDNDTASHYPSNFEMDHIISVSAITPNTNTLTSYANFGATQVDIAARGDDNTTLANSGGNTTVSVDGTSFATAQVSRAAGLLFHAYPNASHYAVKRALMEGVDLLPSTDSSLLVSGGMLNLQKSMDVMNSILNVDECSNNIVVSMTSYENVGTNLEVAVYPNPFKSLLRVDIQYAMPSYKDDLHLELVTIDGRVLKSQLLELNQANTQVSISTKDLVPGVYLLRIYNSSENFVKKVIKLD